LPSKRLDYLPRGGPTVWTDSFGTHLGHPGRLFLAQLPSERLRYTRSDAPPTFPAPFALDRCQHRGYARPQAQPRAPSGAEDAPPSPARAVGPRVFVQLPSVSRYFPPARPVQCPRNGPQDSRLRRPLFHRGRLALASMGPHLHVGLPRLTGLD